MGLFDKKYCDVCGQKIGMLGNRKLDDGNLCKECASKLPPWFSDRKRSTVVQIKEQLAYRESNLEAVRAFHTTRTYGRNVKVLLDEDAKKFMVTSANPNRLEEANPDVVDFSQVTGCDVDINENKSEQYTKDAEGKRVSYKPARYTYSYDFRVIIHVNTPYFDEMRLNLNGSGDVNTGNHPYNFGGRINAEYQQYADMADELKNTILGVRQEIRDAAAREAAPKVKTACPVCGAVVYPDEQGCCEYCGSPLPQ